VHVHNEDQDCQTFSFAGPQQLKRGSALAREFSAPGDGGLRRTWQETDEWSDGSQAKLLLLGSHRSRRGENFGGRYRNAQKGRCNLGAAKGETERDGSNADSQLPEVPRQRTKFRVDIIVRHTMSQCPKKRIIATSDFRKAQRTAK